MIWQNIFQLIFVKLRYKLIVGFLILTQIQTNCLGQNEDYRKKVLYLIDSAWHCYNPDSILKRLEDRPYRADLIQKDQYIAKKLDSLLNFKTTPITKVELTQVMGPNVFIELQNTKWYYPIDTLSYIINGGYILFSVNYNPREGEYFILFMNSSYMSPWNERAKFKNLLYVECEVKDADGSLSGIETFFNYLYAYKYLSLSLQFNKLEPSDEYVFLRKIIVQMTNEQRLEYDKGWIDTITLSEFHSDKMVAYQIDHIIIYMDYEYFIREYKYWWRRYGKGRGIKRKSQKKQINQARVSRSFVIDSIYKDIILQAKTHDTILVSHKPFYDADLRVLVPLEVPIEGNRCAITDINHNRINQVIRKKPRSGIETNYFVPHHEKPFYTIVHWSY